jgi:hypothetical protein
MITTGIYAIIATAAITVKRVDTGALGSKEGHVTFRARFRPNENKLSDRRWHRRSLWVEQF